MLTLSFAFVHIPLKQLGIALCALVLMMGMSAQAQNVTTPPSAPFVSNAGGLLPGPSNSDEGVAYSVNRLLPGATNILLFLIFLFGVPLLICIGLMYFMNELSEGMLDKAKEAMFWFGVGTAISILGYAIVRLIIGINLGG